MPRSPPRRRRPQASSGTAAARLPVRRLPLGARNPHQLLTSDFNPSSSSSNSSAAITTVVTDSSAASQLILIARPRSSRSSRRSTPHESSPPGSSKSALGSDHASSTMSPFDLDIAAAKLRRQQERIQNADAVLNGSAAATTVDPVPQGQQHHGEQQQNHRQNQLGPSRAKGRPVYKSFDINWDTAEARRQQFSEIAAPAAEVRVNTYAPLVYPSYSASVSRSTPSPSQHVAAVELDRQDSLISDVSLQHPYRSQNSSRANLQRLKPFEGNFELKQTTVEACFDKRDIVNVFGCDLPSLEFINANRGAQNGQLQFIQHPNGDVSAHMWYDKRCLWENIGIFSNIRKRIQGQLAADRLKGETGWQTLQKNTLAYFRAIAKQREHITQGHVWNQDEIHKILSHPKDTAPTAAATRNGAVLAPSFIPASHRSNNSLTDTTVSRLSHVQQTIPQDVARLSNLFPFLSDSQTTAKSENLFAVGESSCRESPMPDATTLTDKSAVLDTSIPKFLNESIGKERVVSTRKPPGSASFSSGAGMSPNFPRNTQQEQPIDAVSQSPSVLHDACHPSDIADRSIERGSPQTSIQNTPSRVAPVVPLPFQTREAMRNQLFKLGEAAKERCLVQAVGRTVLHDPFQNPRDQVGISEISRESIQRGESLHHPNSFQGWSNSSSGNYDWPQAGASICLPSHEHRLGASIPDVDSSPVRLPESGHNNRANMDISISHADMHSAPPGKPLSTHEWWTSGSKFARQEEFYQSIKALSVNSTATAQGRTRRVASGARLTQAGHTVAFAPSRTITSMSDDAVPWNESTTRIFLCVYENLASYVQGPEDKRRDYWCRWSQPPEWAIDRSSNGNNSFYDDGWGQPPLRIGRDPRFRPLPEELSFGGFSPAAAANAAHSGNGSVSFGTAGHRGLHGNGVKY